MPPVLYLIDGHALAYRTYYALTRGSTTSRWVTSSGEPTAGVYGFASVLMKILEQEDPDYVAVAFDTGATFRDEIFEDYKGTREKMPDDLVPQIDRIRQLVDAFNIPRLEAEGYEADDVLGSIAKKAVGEGLGVRIFTGDRDLLQLVDERVIVNLPGRSLSDAKDYLSADVVEYMGVRPDQVVDYKALVGDSSDNIPGIHGVGKKTAEKLLGTYDTLDNIYTHLDEITGSLKKKLEEGRDDAYLSKKLAQIVTDLDISIDLERARPSNFKPQDVRDLFRDLEFRTHMKRLEEIEKKYGVQSKTGSNQLTMFADEVEDDYQIKTGTGGDRILLQIVDTREELDRLAQVLKDADVIAFDTETTDTDQMRADLVGISLAVDPHHGYYIPVGHASGKGKNLPLDQVIEAIGPAFKDATIPKSGHNLKYDYVILHRHDLKTEGLNFDSMVAEWLINPASRNLGLKNLAWVRLDHEMTHIEDLIGSGRNQTTMDQVPVEKVAAYAADDAAVVLQLQEQLEEELQATESRKLFAELEMPLIPVLAAMEMNGIALDTDFLNKMSAELSQQLREIEQKVFSAVGSEFNLNSTQQLSEALFDILKLTPPDRTRKTASGYYSTAASVLESMKEEHPIVEWVLDYRELAKLQSTYVDALPTQVNPQTHRVHTSYNQTGSVTGRIASSDPNLQNIPIRTEVGKKVRHAFIASPGYQLMAVDYSQVELRIAAHMADDKAMIEAFKADQDIHATTAAAIYNIPLAEVTPNQRRHAKAINFGLIYGMSPFGLTRTTELTLAEAEDFVQAYFERFPGVKRYLDGIRREARKQGYVETLLGRRRYFPGLVNPSNQATRNREEREAINAPIQGTAADIIKLAMLQVYASITKAGLGAKILLQVHDELVFDVPEAEIQETGKLVTGIMEDIYTLKVPLKTEAKIGPDWGSLELVSF